MTRVLLSVQIEADGSRCAETCPHLRKRESTWAFCRLFRQPIKYNKERAMLCQKMPQTALEHEPRMCICEHCGFTAPCQLRGLMYICNVCEQEKADNNEQQQRTEAAGELTGRVQGLGSSDGR